MAERTIEIEAEFVEEAIKQAKSQVPKGQILLSINIVWDGKPITVKAVAETVEAAFTKAQAEIPSKDDIVEKKTLATPEKKAIIVEGFDEQSAKLLVESQIGNTTVIKALRKVHSGKKGFFGIGKTPNQYEASVLQQAIVEITYNRKAKISAKIGEVEQIKAYLLHHEPEVRRATVELMDSNDYALVSQILVDLLGDVNSDVRDAVIKVTWKRERSVNCKYAVRKLQDEIAYGSEHGILGPTKARQALNMLVQNAPNEEAKAAIKELINESFNNKHSNIANDLDKISELIQERNSENISSIRNFLEMRMNSIQSESYKNFPLLKGFGFWASVQTLAGAFELIATATSDMADKGMPNFSIIATSHSGVSLGCKRALLEKGIIENEVACIQLDMNAKDESNIQEQVKNGKYRYLISDAYRFDPMWNLGSMKGALQNLKRYIKTEVSAGNQMNLFLLAPDTMTTLQVELAFKMFEGSFDPEIFTKDVIAIVPVEESRKNDTLRELAQSTGTWSLDLVQENIPKAIHENDCKQLTRNIELLAHQTDQSAIWTLLENSVKLISSIERNVPK